MDSPTPPGLDVVYEDEALIAVAKPAGRLVIPGRGETGEPLSEAVGRRLGGKAYVVHRLDRGASGLVLFAKTAAAHRELCRLFETREIHKTYRVVVQGEVAADGAVDLPLKEYGSGRWGVAKSGGKPSSTRYRVLKRFAGATVLEVEPVTGRRHQIRVHLYSLGHAVLGDDLYGSPRPVGGAPRLMLHALSLSLNWGGRGLDLRAEPPEDFEAVLAGLSPTG